MPLRQIWLTQRFECAPYDRPTEAEARLSLLHGDDVRQVAHAGAAVVLGDGDAEQAEIAQLPPEVGGEGVLAVDLGRERCDLAGRRRRARVAQHLDGLAEIVVQPPHAHPALPPTPR